MCVCVCVYLYIILLFRTVLTSKKRKCLYFSFHRLHILKSRPVWFLNKLYSWRTIFLDTS